MSWNGSGKGSDSASTPNLTKKRKNGTHLSPACGFNFKALLAGFIIVCIGGVRLYFINVHPASKAPQHTQKEAGTRQIKEVVPQCESSTNTGQNAVRVPTNKESARYERGVLVVSSRATTNLAGAVTEHLTLADGRKIAKVHIPKPIFENASDDLIATVLSTKPGQSMPPLPDLHDIDKDFMKSLLEPIRIDENDSEKVKELKLAVKEARAYIAAEIKNGRTVQECLAAHRDEMERMSDSHEMAVLEINKMRKEGGSEEEISAFRDRVNEVFREKGFPELTENAHPRNHRKAKEGR